MNSTNNELLKFIYKSIQFFVSFLQIYRSIFCKKYQQLLYLHLFQKVFIHGYENQIT